MTTRRITSGDESNHRNGLGGGVGFFDFAMGEGLRRRSLPRDYHAAQFGLTKPYGALLKIGAAAYASRISTLKAAIAKSEFKSYTWDSAAQDFVHA